MPNLISIMIFMMYTEVKKKCLVLLLLPLMFSDVDIHFVSLRKLAHAIYREFFQLKKVKISLEKI